MSHYYTEKNEDVKSNLQTIKVKFLDNIYSFYTDNGVFCKDYLDFGTRVLLENATITGTKILDLGCGYGPVGVILGQDKNLDITMVDINERAVLLAQKNVLLNGVNAKVLKSNILENVDDLFTCILTNPPIRAGKETVFSFYRQSYEHSVDGGTLYVVIQKKQGAESSIKFLKCLFGNCWIICKEKGYYILKSTK